MSVRPISSTFQQMGGIRNVANFTEQCRRLRKEVYEAIVHVRMSTGIWVTGNVFNGLLILVDDQRGRIEVSGASGIKEEVTHPRWDVVLQDIFVFGLSMDTNQIWVFIYKPHQALSIRDITDVSYLPEGSGNVSFHHKRKVYYWHWAWTSDSLPETFVEEITRFSEKLVEVEGITFPGQV